MSTLDRLIPASTEFICECWGQGDATVTFYAPITRVDGAVWMHPTWAREYPWAEICAKASRIWRVSGSLWNPGNFVLIWNKGPDRDHGRHANS